MSNQTEILYDLCKNSESSFTRIDIINCPLCKTVHYGLELSKLGVPVDDYTHAATCCFTNKQFYLRINIRETQDSENKNGVAWHECVPSKENCTICGD